MTVTALAAAADSYDFSGVDSFTLGGGFIDAAVVATNAVNFARIKGLKSFGVKNTTATTAITVALDDLANGLAKSESAGLLTVSLADAAKTINVAGFSGAGNLAFDGAAVKATVSNVGSSSISALGNVKSLVLTDSSVDTLKGATGTLDTLAFHAKGTITATDMATAGAADVTVTATRTAGSATDDSKIDGTFNQPTAQSVKMYANNHNVTGFEMKDGGSVVAALSADGKRATSATYKLARKHCCFISSSC